MHAPSQPDRHPSSDRRDFLRRVAAGSAAILAWPELLDALGHRLPAGGGAPDDEDFWKLVRGEFLIPDDRVYFNIGTLGPQPRVVMDAAIEHMRRVAMTYPPGIDWDDLKGRLGGLLNCDPAGLVFPRNTTEGMNFVAQGLDLEPGDEILTTDHEHIGGLCCWQLLAARRGLRLRQLPLPVPPADPAEVVALIERAISPRTRVVSASHVTFTTGFVLPVGEIAALCRERGIISVIDGAHPPGLMRIDLRAIDPDFYASSPHKWLLAPQGTGFLFIREDWRTRLWPTLASGGWDDLSLGAHRFNHLGTFDESRLAGLAAAIRFHQTIGTERIEARARLLRRRLADRLADLRGLRIVSPPDGPMVAGMVSFAPPGTDALELQKRLAAAHIRTRVIGEYGYGWMRLSPFIYNTMEEVDRVVAEIGRKAA